MSGLLPQRHLWQISLFWASSLYSVTSCTNVSHLLQGRNACSALMMWCFAGFGLQLGWEGEPNRADTGSGKWAFNNQEWNPPGSPGKLQNGDQTLAVSHPDCHLCCFLTALSLWPSRSLSKSWLMMVHSTSPRGIWCGAALSLEGKVLC